MLTSQEGGDAHGPTSRAGRRAVGPADVLRGQSRAFQRLVEKTKALIARAALPIGVAFSGGKDSTVALHLTRSVFPDAPAGFYDSGAELQDTLDFVRSTPGVEIFPADGGGLIQLCKENGYWDHPPESPTPRRVKFDEALLYGPAQRFIEAYHLRTLVLGLRAEESAGRRFNAKVRGYNYDVAYISRRVGYPVAHLCPLQWWTEDDVWAYIAAYNVPYNPAYDKMAALGIPRRAQRICTVLGTEAANFGRFVHLKQLDPGLWNRLVSEFPLLRKYV